MASPNMSSSKTTAERELALQLADDRVNGGKRIYTLEVKLPEDELKTLKKLAEKQGLSLNGAIQRAIANEEYMRAEIEAGNQIIVEGRNGKSYRLTFKE
ncbi:MAG: ribbon-helix-helix protein, CopG family [Pseudanabaenaceae cyanobacterium bins.68]|nr:ribbon-helix-helix protein, CopG family [Pseudanabaenaceae cyanobacterium bins.68]